MARSKAKQGGRRSGRFNEAWGKNWKTDGFTPPKSLHVGNDAKGMPIMVDSARGENKRWRALGTALRIGIEQVAMARYFATRGEAPHRLEEGEAFKALKPVAVFTVTFLTNAAKSGTLRKTLKTYSEVIDQVMAGGDSMTEAA